MKRLLAIFVVALCAFGLSAQVTITKEDKERAAAIVAKMTLDEKIDFISGVDWDYTRAVPSVGIPKTRLHDGPQGSVGIDDATGFPCCQALAASWNRAMVRMDGAAYGREAKALGIDCILGPGVNIYRTALCGRNYEYMGEDPYLASETAANYISGIQSENVFATIKHFCCNNQDYDRYGVSSNCGERALNEIYFPTFRKAVEQAHVGAVMTSYNALNGTHTAENAWLIRENLRRWGHDGIVMSDWVSTYSTMGCLMSGLDLEMPGAHAFDHAKVKALVENGVISEALIDEKVQHIVQTYCAFGILDMVGRPKLDLAASAEKSYKMALECPVLLKNNGVLPLKKGSIVVIGPAADMIMSASGSGCVFANKYSITLQQGLKNLAKKYKYKITYMKEDAINAAVVKKAAAVVVAVGFPGDIEGEGFDRPYALPDAQNKLIKDMAKLNGKTAVVVFSGGEFDINGWKDDVAAIMWAPYTGNRQGQAVADLLAGKVSPSGRLPFTFWGSLEKNPVLKNYHIDSTIFMADREKYAFVEYNEGVFVGYRGVEHYGVKPMYPFGYGLSYSTFEYSRFDVLFDGRDYDIYVTLTNTGKVTASEVVEAYVEPVDSKIVRPARELRGYDKVTLAPGSSARVLIHIDREALGYYDDFAHAWKVAPGKYNICVGRSSADIVERKQFDVK